jgi:hypothetical protein
LSTYPKLRLLTNEDGLLEDKVVARMILYFSSFSDSAIAILALACFGLAPG